MSISDDSLPILSSLSDAIKTDDIRSLESLLSTKPEILELAAQIWPENPFILAYNSKSLHVMKEIGRRKPEFVKMIDQDGNTILHLACATGDDLMVIVLVEIDSQLCFVQDNLSMIPLHTAIKHGRRDGVVRELVLACPESLGILNSQLETVFHVAVKNNKCDAFKVLLEEARKYDKEYLLKMKDAQGNTVLHVAVSNNELNHGREDVVRELISACPESLRTLTSQLETVFHVAVKNNNCDAFIVLLDEARKRKKGNLLKMKDDQGNTVLHVAVSNELIQVMENILICHLRLWGRRGTDLLELVNSTNKKGHTAMDLCNMSNSSVSADQIHPILIELGATESNTLRKPESSTSSMWLTEKREVLLVILPIFIGVVFTVSSALPTYFPKDKINVSEPFQFEAVASGRLPLVFYFLVCLTVTLTISACFLTVLLYELPLGYLLFLSGIAIFFLYILLADYIMPEFFIKLGSHEISSYRLMWVLALSYIFAGTLLLLVGKYLLLGFNKFTDWLIMRRRQDSNLLYTRAEVGSHSQSAEIEMK